MAPVDRAGSSVILSAGRGPPWMAIFEHLPSAVARSHEKLTSKPKLRANSSFPMVPPALPQTKVLPSCEPKCSLSRINGTIPYLF